MNAKANLEKTQINYYEASKSAMMQESINKKLYESSKIHVLNDEEEVVLAHGNY